MKEKKIVDVRIRLDKEFNAELERVLSKYGQTRQSVARLLYQRIVKDKKIPIEIYDDN